VQNFQLKADGVNRIAARPRAAEAKWAIRSQGLTPNLKASVSIPGTANLIQEIPVRRGTWNRGVQKPAPQYVVFGLQKGFKFRPGSAGQRLQVLFDETLQQHIQFFHAATAKPLQFPDALIPFHARLNSDASAGHQHFLGFSDGFCRIQALGTGFCAVHDGVAAIQPERVFQVIQALSAGLVA